MPSDTWSLDGTVPSSYLNVADRSELGRQARKQAPRASHADWVPTASRRDPVTLLEEQNAARVEQLVPIRHGRMRVSAFTFYRGTARIMAADLAHTPNSGLRVQLGGDAHLSNFGAYASTERNLVFDANDFDETLPGPWEWDLKRLATSFVVAAQDLGYDRTLQRKAATTVARSYQKEMLEHASGGYLDTWYDHLGAEDVAGVVGQESGKFAKRLNRFQRKARSKNSLQAMKKLTIEKDSKLLIRNDAPFLVPLRDLPKEISPELPLEVARETFEAYQGTLSDDRNHLLSRYTPIDLAMKVVGVGSVGTRCWIMLLQGSDRKDPLFLQLKEAGPSVLEEFLEPTEYGNAGQRVVAGQRLVQAQSDIFLGWTEGFEGRQFYVRQLRDWKGSVETSALSHKRLNFYAKLCGRTLARGHARSGDPVAISGYLGKGKGLAHAIADFGLAYSVQNQADYEAFQGAIEAGRLPVSDQI